MLLACALLTASLLQPHDAGDPSLQSAKERIEACRELAPTRNIRDDELLHFEAEAFANLAVGDALPRALTSVAGEGLRLTRRSPLHNALHFRFEHPDEPAREASLLLHEGRLCGVCTHVADARSVIKSVRKGVSSVHVEDAAADAPCGIEDVETQQAPMHVEDGAIAGDSCDDGSTLDILVVYTSAAVTQAGSTTQLNDSILWAIADMNAIFAASTITLQARLAATALVANFTEDPANIASDLTHLREPNDGVMDEVHALRNTVGADLVALVRANGSGSCGISIIGGSSSATSESAFSVTMLGCFASRTFTHELGHNLGCCHAPGDGGACYNGAVFPYSTGHRFIGSNGTEYRTVMAYEPGTRIGHFSSPLVTVSNTPTGIADQRDNARSINQTRFVVTNYRCAPCPTDFDGDEWTAASDLSFLLGAWGTAAADLDGDNRTLASDLAILLGHWGICP